MHGQDFFLQAFVYLLAGVISVPIAKRLGLGSVLGYLIAGTLIGPFVLGLVGDDGGDVLHFAEFGVVMMLFLIGLELDPKRLWRLRGQILGLGGLQIAGTTLVLGSVALLMGSGVREATAIGLILALSSTAIVLQTLEEKGLMRTESGQNAFAVLLAQDIAVIPILALLPLLATAAGRASADGHHDSHGWLDSLPPAAQGGVVLGAVALVVLGGRFLLRPAFRFIAQARLREVFTGAALLLVIGIALLMSEVGLSPALGTFLAGVVLASSEYRHELESSVEPFKGLLLGLFFISVGASIDFALIGAGWQRIGLMVAVLVVVKLVVLSVLGRVFGLSLDQNVLFSAALAQGSEFAFVLLSFALQSQVLSSEVTEPWVAAVAISMALTPLLMLVAERLLLPRFGTKESHRQPDVEEEHNDVLIAGFGRFGQIVGRYLEANGIRATYLDNDSNQVDLLRSFGQKVYYGDATRLDLLRTAGAEDAKVLVAAIDDRDELLEVVQLVRHHFPNLEIVARARGRTAAYELLELGVDRVFRETFDAALRTGVETLEVLGFRAHSAHRSALAFRRLDEQNLLELATQRDDQARYINLAKQRAADLQQVLGRDLAVTASGRSADWDASSRSSSDSAEASGAEDS